MAFNEKFVDHIVGNYKAPKDAIALDIGANRGMYTVKMAKKFDKVYAIEYSTSLLCTCNISQK